MGSLPVKEFCLLRMDGTIMVNSCVGTPQYFFSKFVMSDEAGLLSATPSTSRTVPVDDNIGVVVPTGFLIASRNLTQSLTTSGGAFCRD